MKIISLFFAWLLSFALLQAQGGSNYSIFGFGDINQSIGASYNGMGGTAAAMPLEENINTKNPALWTYNRSTRIQTGYRFNQALVSDGGNSLYQNFGGFEGIQVLFNVDTSLGLSFSGGLYPYSAINYSFASPITLTRNGETVDGKALYKGSGGLSALYVGGSVKILEELRVGVNINKIFGYKDSDISTDFEEVFSWPSTTVFRDMYDAVYYTAGLALIPMPGLTLGFAYQSPFDMDVEKQTRYLSIQPNTPDTTFVESASYPVRGKLSLGASFRTGKFLIGADFSTQDFEGLDYDLNDKFRYKSSTLISAGLQRTGNKSRMAPYFDRVHYRFGLAYNALYYKASGTDISEFALSLGGGFPLPGSGIIDLGLALGQRGTTDADLLKEMFGRLSVTLSIGETWFDPYERQYE